MKLLLALLITLGIASALANTCPKYNVKIVKKTGKKASQIKWTVDNYRKILGGEDNGSEKGSLITGHRSVRASC